MMEIYAKLNNLKVDSILDMATGRGGFLHELCPLFEDYQRAVGVDSNEKAINAAEEQNRDERISFRKMDCAALEFDDEFFDVVSICNSLHHFSDKTLILTEALRVLKPGGIFIVSEMFHSSDERPSQSTHSEFHHWWGEIDSALGTYHDRTFTKKELLEIVQALPLSSLEFEQFDGEDEDIHSEDVIKQLTGAYTMYEERALKLDNSRDFIRRGKALLEKLKTDGFAPASRLEFICMK